MKLSPLLKSWEEYIFEKAVLSATVRDCSWRSLADF
jgi:hypothetical protein